MNSDKFSAPEAGYFTFVTVFNAGTVAHAALLGIPGFLVTDNTAKLADYTAAYYTAKDPNAGKIDRENRRKKRDALSKSIRKIKNAYVDPDPLDVITPEILLDFGLEPRVRIHKDVPAPTEVVPFTLAYGGYLQIIVKHPTNPVRYNGAVAFYKVGGTVPETYKELTSSKLLTRSRGILSFEDIQLSQTLYIALCWENQKGELGPFSPIQSRVIA